MAAEPSADNLRAMAAHRGLKLVKSRRRSPGVGDYGKFGLTDAKGKALIGIGDEGLTATADEIEAYLRGGAVSSWKLSADTTPDRPPPRKKPKADAQDPQDAPVARRARQEARTTSSKKPTTPAREQAPPPPRATPVLRLVPAKEAQSDPPAVHIRTAGARDAASLASLFEQLAGPRTRPADVTKNLAAMKKSKAGLIVAETDALVGCCAWAIIATPQHGATGRLTLLLVDKAHRRRGIATEMIGRAEKDLAKAGCTYIEVMSDIMINNAHNFFRSRGFEQASYRFVRTIEA